MMSLMTEATLCWSVRKYFHSWCLVMLNSPTSLLLRWIISFAHWTQDRWTGTLFLQLALLFLDIWSSILFLVLTEDTSPAVWPDTVGTRTARPQLQAGVTVVKTDNFYLLNRFYWFIITAVFIRFALLLVLSVHHLFRGVCRRFVLLLLLPQHLFFRGAYRERQIFLRCSLACPATCPRCHMCGHDRLDTFISPSLWCARVEWG